MNASDLKFTKSHEWIGVEGGVATLGLTDYAQGELGDIVFVELPEVGRAVSPGDVLTSVESVKSVSEIYVPVAGEITAVNEGLDDDPAAINSDPYGAGWMVKVKLAADADLSAFMTAGEYEEHIKG